MMKGLKVIIVFVLISIVACQKSEKSDVSKTEKTVKEFESTRTYEAGKLIKGEFIYLDNLAVLKGDDFIYGIKMNDKANELVKKTNKVKRDSFDMIPVILTGEITKSEQKNTWEEWLIIEDIVEVKAPQKQKVKLETK